MEKIRHDSSYEWLSGESWKEWSASFFSMGWKIWGVVLITELFLFLFFKPTADCGRLRYGWLFIVRPSGLQLLLLFVYRLLTGRQKRVYSRRAMAGCAIFLLTSYAAVMAWVHTSVTLMPMVLLLPMLLTPLYKDRVMTLVQAALLVAAYVLDCVYFIPASSYFPLTTPFIEGSIFVGTVCGMLVALELVNDSAIVNDERSKRDSLTKLYNHESFYEEGFCARYGGEEFAIIFKGAGVGQAEEMAEQIRQEFEQKMFTTPQGERSFSVSIGVAEYDRAYPGASAFFEVADAALYCAKREGKNQVRR